MNSEQEKYNELSYYTLAHPDPSFIHQHIVDAYAAQHADENDKPIALYFALVGLYLHVEKKYSGKEVQRAHMRLAKEKKEWPIFRLPEQRGVITVLDVLKTLPGSERDKVIEKWCVYVWSAYKNEHETIKNLVQVELGQ